MNELFIDIIGWRHWWKQLLVSNGVGILRVNLGVGLGLVPFKKDVVQLSRRLGVVLHLVGVGPGLGASTVPLQQGVEETNGDDGATGENHGGGRTSGGSRHDWQMNIGEVFEPGRSSTLLY